MSECRLSRLLNSILISEHRGAIYDVADLMGETYNHVHKQISGYTNVHVNTLKSAFIVTKDPRLKRELEPDGYELIPARTATATKCPESEITDVILHAARLIEMARNSLEDGTITRDEADALEKQFCQIEKELIEARAAIRSAAANNRVRAVK